MKSVERSSILVKFSFVSHFVYLSQVHEQVCYVVMFGSTNLVFMNTDVNAGTNWRSTSYGNL